MTKKTTKNSSIVKRPAVVKRQMTAEDVVKILDRVVQNVGMPITREGLAGRLGSQFGGDRQLYDTFGYPATLTYDDYRAQYDRNGMATRIVEKFSKDTWNKPPVIIDGEARSDMVGSNSTKFLDEWNALTKELKVWQTLLQADIMCGLGRYSLVFMGTAGNFANPVHKNTGLYYLNAFDENQVKIHSYVTNKKNRLYGMPEMYDIKMDNLENELGSTIETPVHRSRCIHVSEDRLGSRIYGRPRLQEIFNRLMDIEKVVGGGAEAAWLAVYMGFLILTREGVELPPEESAEWQAVEQTIQNFAHRIQRFATLRGVEEVVNLGVHEVKVKDIYSVVISDLAGSKGIPQRVLIGSERGELASSQDMREWNGVIDSRRTNFAEPELLDPFIKWCIDYGIVSEPKSGDYKKEWQPVYTMSEIEQADYALKIAEGANQLTASGGEVIDADEYRGVLKFPPRKKQITKPELTPPGTGTGDGKSNGKVPTPETQPAGA